MILYKNKGWISWSDWLGSGYIATYKREYLSFEEARSYARTLKLKNREEWKDYCKSGNKLNNMPSNPQQVYKNKGWINWENWVGK